MNMILKWIAHSREAEQSNSQNEIVQIAYGIFEQGSIFIRFIEEFFKLFLVFINYYSFKRWFQTSEVLTALM